MTEEEVKKIVTDAIAASKEEKKEITEIAKPEKAPINIDGLYKIFRTSNLKATDILLVKSDNEYVAFDYAEEFAELFERLDFKPIIVTVRAKDSFDIITEEKLNEMGYFRQEKTK